MKTVNYFCEKLHLRYLTGFWICFWVEKQLKFFQIYFAITKKMILKRSENHVNFREKSMEVLSFSKKSQKVTYFFVCKLSLSSSFLGKLFRKVIVEISLRGSSRSNLKISQKINLPTSGQPFGNNHTNCSSGNRCSTFNYSKLYGNIHYLKSFKE